MKTDSGPAKGSTYMDLDENNPEEPEVRFFTQQIGYFDNIISSFKGSSNVSTTMSIFISLRHYVSYSCSKTLAYGKKTVFRLMSLIRMGLYVSAFILRYLSVKF